MTGATAPAGFRGRASRPWRRAAALAAVAVAAAALSACAEADVDLRAAGSWPAADALFRQDPRWLGGDGALTVDLDDPADGPGAEPDPARARTLWLFGDSFIALTPRGHGGPLHMVRNSVAIQTGRDPAAAHLAFAYRQAAGTPSSFQPEEGDRWFWPGDGLRVGDRLVVFWGRLFQDAPGMWGFASDGWRAFVYEGLAGPPTAWTVSPALLPATSHGVQLGDAVVRDGDHVYVYGRKGDGHGGRLARFPVDAFAAGDLRAPQWWCGGSFDVDCAEPAALYSLGAPEFSVQFDAHLGLWLLAQSLGGGIGTTTLAVRTAPRPEGPWSEPRSLWRPPASHDDTAMVYAAKGHAGLRGADLVMTYVPGSIEAAPDTPYLYHPHFARLDWR